MISPQHDLIYALASKLKLGSILKVHQITGKGEVNDIFLTYCASGKYIFRLNSEGELPRFQKEAWCIEQAQRVGVPGPKIIEVGSEHGLSYMVMSYLEGELAADLSGPKTKIWRQVGQYARKIHGIDVAGFGENIRDMISDTRSKWSEYLDYNIASLNTGDKLLSLGIVNLDESGYMKRSFESLRKKTFSFGLTHGDLSLKNFIVGPTDTLNVIDWGSAEAHVVPHHEFGVILGFSLTEGAAEFEAFLDGYGLSAEEFLAIRQEVRDIQLLVSTDHLRWAIDRSPELISEYSDGVRKLLRLRNAS